MDGCIEGKWIIEIYELYGRDWGDVGVGRCGPGRCSCICKCGIAATFIPTTYLPTLLIARLPTATTNPIANTSVQFHLNRTLNKMCSGGKSQEYSLSKLYAENSKTIGSGL
jgi:hypothetical protein